MDTSSPTQIPSRKAERTILFALCLVSFGMALNVHAMGALKPFLGAIFTVEESALGMLIGAAGLAGAVGAVLLGPVVDRVGRRGPLVWGTVIFALSSLVQSFVEGYEMHFALRCCTGFSGGVVFTTATAALADMIPYERRGGAMGILTASVFLAVPVGMPVAVLTAGAGYWRGIFVLQAVVGVFAAVFLFVSFPRTAGSGRRISQWSVLQHAGVKPALLSVVLYTGAFFTTVQFTGGWLDETGILAKGDQAWMWVILGLVSAAGSVVLTRFADRTGKLRFVLVTTAMVGFGVLSLRFVDTQGSLALVGLPLAMVAAARSGALMALVSSLVPKGEIATLMGVRAAAVNLGMGVFPIAGGFVLEAEGFGGFVYAAFAAIVLAHLLVQFFVREPEGV